MKIIDSHCHIYPERIAHKAIESIAAFYGGLPVKVEFDGTAGMLLESGKSCGISRFVVHSVATKPEQAAHINEFLAGCEKAAGSAAVGGASTEGEVSDVSGSRESARSRIFTALGTVHPYSETLDADLAHLTALGLHGVKLHPDTQHFPADDPKAFRIYEYCEAYGLPVLLHTGDYRFDYSNPERIVPILRAFPNLTLIGAHFAGWSVWDRAAALLPDFPNLLVDSSSTFFWKTPEEAMDLIRAYGPERVLFGTDYPMWRPEPDLAFMEKLPLSEEEREQIFWKNCAGVYGIEG